MEYNLVPRDLSVIWHPYTQMKTAPEPVAIIRGKEALLYDEQGNVYIDAVSSWWVNIHGHGNDYIADRIAEQARTLEHCIFAGFTHPPAVELAEKLLKILPGNFSKIFYSDNGSTAVEVAVKMAIQYWHNQGIPKKKILAFHHAYHGDTFGAMSVSARSIFTRVFDPYLFEVDFLELPAAGNMQQLIDHVTAAAKETAAFIFEPLLLGSGGMLMYEPEHLDQLLKACHQHDILLIADEVMTGFGRTGKKFAMEYVQQQADIVCLSKGLTGGTMALGVTACTQDIYDAFLSDDKLKTLFHGHSFTANPIACTAALASMDIFLSPSCSENIARVRASHRRFAQTLQAHPGVKNVRQCGTVVAFEVVAPDEDSYVNSLRDKLYEFFIRRHIILRPLGNTLYIMPPYCITDEQLQEVYDAICALLDEFQRSGMVKSKW